MPPENKTLSIIIPIFNEIKFIDKFLYELLENFGDVNCKYILIDDGSTDGTSFFLEKKLDSLFKNKNLKHIKFDKNLGKAKAIKKGIEYIEGEYTLMLDSDLEYDISDAKELYEIALSNKSIEIIQGSRYLGGKVQSRKYFFNDIAVRINTFIFNFLFGQSITDTN